MIIIIMIIIYFLIFYDLWCKEPRAKIKDQKQVW